MEKIKNWRPGILPSEYLKYLKDKDLIKCSNIEDSSIDLQLSHMGWEMEGCIKPSANKRFSTILGNREYAQPFVLSQDEIKTLEAHKTYVFQLQEELNLGDNKFNICGQSTGKSSIGRLDVLTRLIVDNTNHYDELPNDYSGSLYITTY